jgi:alpha-glucosidase
MMNSFPKWTTGAIYQVCVPSFQDTDGDGLGDLCGITNRLEYLAWLGVTTLWLTPFYRTQFFDFGYDVADHTAIDVRFGTLPDFHRLLEDAHRLGLRIVVDFVPNHTSIEHPWFIDSRSSRESAHRDWYIWRDARPGSDLPNNWTTQYERSAWTWDEHTQQFYFHSFHENQPDLNWASPEVHHAMASVMRFWLAHGVDGFRIDAMVHLMKDPQWRDNPPAPDKEVDDWPTWPMMPAFTQDQANLLPIVEELCRVVNEYPERIIIGENHLPPGRLPSYYQAGVTHPVNSQLLDSAWDASAVRRKIDGYEGLLGCGVWPNWVLGSHDNSRVASRLGETRIRAAAMLHLTLRGTPIIYYGEEIGMADVPLTATQLRDPLGRLMPNKGLGRDAQRTPMSWDDSPHSGFSAAPPWLPTSSRNNESHVAKQRDDPHSILNLYHRLLQLRANEPALQRGSYLPDVQTQDAFAYIRRDEHSQFLVAINFTGHIAALESASARGAVQLSTQMDRTGEAVDGKLTLRSNEGIIVKMRA